MFEIPPLDQLAPGAVIVGVLFAFRLLLAVRRLREEADGRAGFGIEDLRRIRQPGSYGANLEPNRRYALRQLVTSVFFLVAGALIGVWLLVATVAGPSALGGPSA